MSYAAAVAICLSSSLQYYKWKYDAVCEYPLNAATADVVFVAATSRVYW